MERMRRDIKERARKRAVGEIIDVESGLEENEDDRKCMKELATVDHIKMDNLVEPSSNNNFFGPSSNDGFVAHDNRDWDHVELNQGGLGHRLDVGKKAPGIGRGHG